MSTKLFAFFTKSLNNARFDELTDEVWTDTIRDRFDEPVAEVFIIKPTDWKAPALRSIEASEAKTAISNYVIFNSEMQSILAKYGVPSPIVPSCMGKLRIIPFPNALMVAFVLPYTDEMQKLARMETCDNCKQDTEVGELYQFYYGSRIGTSSSQQGAVITRTTAYSIAGSKYVFICSKCMIPRIIKNAIRLSAWTAVLGGIFIWGGLSALRQPDPGSNPIAMYMFCIAPGSLLALFALYVLIRNVAIPLNFQRNNNRAGIKKVLSDVSFNQDVGDKFAIDINKEQLSSYNRFFTRSQYGSLK